MNKAIKSLLESKGFKQHPEDQDKMICELGDRGGIIVFGFDGEFDDMFEFILSYNSRGVGDPELILSGLTESDLHQHFTRYFELARNFYVLLENSEF